MNELLFNEDSMKILIAAFSIGIVVGMTGMGGGALMTPALVILGVPANAAVANDLVAAAINKTVGAAVHARRGKPNMELARWIMVGSIPAGFAGGFIVQAMGTSEDQIAFIKAALGIALLITAATYVLRMVMQIREVSRGKEWRAAEPVVRPLPTIVVGAIGGLLVGITSVGAGSLIMIALVLLYPGLTPMKLVGTDLVQAVPLVIAAAVGHVITNGVTWAVLVPLVVGGTPGTFLGARTGTYVRQSYIRRGIVVVLTVTGLYMLQVPGVWAALIGLLLLTLLPIVWGQVREAFGLPRYSTPKPVDTSFP
jgi:uncharacterized membrane protein YfcA